MIKFHNSSNTSYILNYFIKLFDAKRMSAPSLERTDVFDAKATSEMLEFN